MSFETAAPPNPPPPLPEIDHVVVVPNDVLVPPVRQAPPARPARGYEASNVLLPGPVPGVTTYRLRGTETVAVEDPPTA